MWVAFFLRERRAAEPVINPRLFRNQVFTVSAVAGALQMAAMFGAIMFLPLFVQGVLGKSATNSGIILMPLMLGAIASSIVSGQILARTGKYKVVVIVGYFLSTVGAYLLSRMSVDTTWGTLTLDMIVMGLGMGVGMSAFTVIVQNQYPARRLGEVSAGLQFFRSIGGTIGLAVFGTVLNNQFAAAMKTNLPPALQKYESAAALDNPQVLLSEAASQEIRAMFAKFGEQGEALFAAFMQAVRLSLDAAISDLFLIATVVGVLGLIVVLFLREDPLRKTHLTFEQEEMLAAEAEAGATGGFTPEGSVAEDGQEPVISYGSDEADESRPT
jgi:MFS family permease